MLQRIGKGASKREGGPCPASKDRERSEQEGGRPMPCFQGKLQGKEKGVIYRISWKNDLGKVMGKIRRTCERE